jgi:PAS domain S-box-containing protein
MRWRTGLWWRVTAAATAALAVTAVALVIALTAAAQTRAAGRELDQRLVPAAAAAGVMMQDYTTQTVVLRNYINTGQAAQLAAFNAAGRQIARVQAELGRLLRGYPGMPGRLAAVGTALHAWLAHVAGPQLAAAARGDYRLARAMQNNIGRTRPYGLAVRSRGTALQAQITSQQAAVTDRLLGSQGLLIGALAAICVLVVAIAAGAVLVVRRWLLRPFTALRQATEEVAAGHYEHPIPAQGPAEFAALARGAEAMRSRLLAALAERERAELGFRRMFESAPDATLAVAADGKIVMANAQAGRLFGYPDGELVGQHVDKLVPRAARAGHAAHRAAYAADPHARPMGADLHLKAVRRDGTEVPVEISLNGLPDGHAPLVIATARDISERLAFEAEREQLRAEAERERAQRRLQQAQKLESIGQLVGGVAHDFNNLLNVISGYTDLAAEQVTAYAATDQRLQPVAADIGQVREAAQQATRLTRQLLTFARHDVVKPEIINLNDAIEGVRQLLSRTLGEHIGLTINASPDLAPVEADRGQLEQVLLNLAINARDAMPGGGQLTIETDNTDVDEAYAATHPGLRPGSYIRLRVSDTGVGMDAATVARVFEPFFTTKPKGHGTGLGLATVYGIITQAGGTIQIYSEPGMGTTISALLPAASGILTPAPAAPLPTSEGLRGHGEAILLVEDEESLRELAYRILTRNDYRVHQSPDAPHAVFFASNPAQRIDLLLTDIVMPDMLGTQVAAQIRQHRPSLPVLYMSGYAQPVLDSHGAARASMDILEKPFTEATLLTRIYQALHPAPRAPAPRENANGGA